MTDTGIYPKNGRQLPWNIVVWLVGMLMGVAGSYLAYPKNLVTKDYFDERLAAIEAHLDSTDKRVDDNSDETHQNRYDIGAVKERLNMK